MNVFDQAAAGRTGRWCRKPLQVAVLGLLLGAGQAMAGTSGLGVEPEVLEGNPRCTALGSATPNFEFGFKIDLGADAVFGKWPIYYTGEAPSGDLETKSKVLPDGATKVGYVTITPCSEGDDFCLDFDSTVAVGGVIVKGANNANLYDYRPQEGQVRIDTGLTTPLGSAGNNNDPEISHVNFCFDEFPTVEASKTASTRFDREYLWEIDKQVEFDEEELTFDYTITVTNTGFEDRNLEVFGDISLTNISGLPVSVESVTDDFDGAVGAVSVECELPADVAVLHTLSCAYVGASDGTNGTNTAKIDYIAFNGPGTAEPKADFSFDDAFVSEVDACVDVWDLLTIDVEVIEGDAESFTLPIDRLIIGQDRDSGATVCFDDEDLVDGSIEFTYTLSALPELNDEGKVFDSTPWDQIAPGQCIDIRVSNDAVIVPVGGEPEAIAEFQSLQSTDIAEAFTGALIQIRECPEAGGCTRTRGYWQTHSIFGPAPYDDTWAEIGETAPFFTSGLSWIEAIRTPPRGDAYFQLAPQFIAATLNGLAGTSVEVIEDELKAAEELFKNCNPGDFDQGQGGNPRNRRPPGACADLQAEARRLAGILDAYNNDVLEGGPVQCFAVEIGD